MINFEKVKWKNFLSTGNYFNEVSLDTHNVTVVSGKNGHGKSTMLDALCYCLFNKGFRNIPKGNFINSINGRELLVEVEFSIGKKKYLVRRGSKPNVFEIEVDGKMLDQVANVRDQQSYLEKNILRLNWKAFTQVVVLGSAAHVPFMQLKTVDRREIVEELLDLQVFSQMKNILSDRVNALKENILQIDGEISVLSTQIELEKKYMERSKEDVSVRVEGYKKDIEETLCLIEEERKSITKIGIEASEIDIKTLQSDITTNQKKLYGLSDIKSKLEQRIKLLNKEVDFFEKNSTCPTCTQEITDEWKSLAMSNRNETLDECAVGMSKLEEKMCELEKTIVGIENELDGVKSLNNKITSHKHNISLHEKFLTKVQYNIDEANRKTETISDEEQLEKDTETLKEKETKLEELKEVREVYNNASVLLKDTGIKSSIIRQYIPIINHFMTQYLSTMDFFVKFELDENFEESIKSRHLDDFKYSNFSEGEKQRINLSILMSWRDIARKKNSMNTNLIILDEVFDSAMDSEGIEAFIKIIKGLKNQNIFIITHKADLMIDKFESDRNRVITFEKRKNFSYVNENN
jgi:DNA repair exonuclease SbcCD ATPase subunit